ncbi:hypothetical protein HYFRA_00008235 [Hymenoscyphus fraxineus]|uniref:Uncharacterized protein n=1 Tax=Hymenoscyphus fraxineus TaxID=746836 RepID=A0A9N9PYM2_9HELO|nr:hypothetical protein HYFRA_00008235 [Hymenoscyphus fraxineus]
MTSDGTFIFTSLSRAPSTIHVTSENKRVFTQLPDIIQEAAIGTAYPHPNFYINRIPETANKLKRPTFLIAPRNDSGVSLPNINVTDEKFLAKYGSDLSANFADIRTMGGRAFLQKENMSNGSWYSLCTCATGYIWVTVRYLFKSPFPDEQYSDIEIQIGTFALKARAITTVEVPCQYLASSRHDPLDGQLAFLCSMVIGKYLRLRIMGDQYESATETAITEARKELSAWKIVDPGRFGNFEALLKEICASAPMPPTSVVSLISRNMIMERWKGWSDNLTIKKRYALPRQIIWSLQPSKYDHLDLLRNSINPSAINKFPTRKQSEP